MLWIVSGRFAITIEAETKEEAKEWLEGASDSDIINHIDQFSNRLRIRNDLAEVD
jgi:hypothetical protein